MDPILITGIVVGVVVLGLIFYMTKMKKKGGGEKDSMSMKDSGMSKPSSMGQNEPTGRNNPPQ